MTDILHSPVFVPGYALEAVPRYTSYPPATQFNDGICGGAWAGWMSETPAEPVLSLYVHIPFCRSMCWYCGCNTTVPNRDSRIERYLEALLTEIATRPAPAHGKVHHVHFGGGSPDMLSPARFGAVMDALRARYEFAADAEIAVELDPRGLDSRLCEALAANGVTRASLGVQDLSEEVQTLIHRIQPREQVEAAVRALRSAGISRINMDVMYGLPAQTIERVEATARAVAGMDADRVSVFGYAHVPWFKKHQRAIPEDRLPGARARFDQMLAAARTLTEAGYSAIGFDHFARPEDPLAQAARDGSLRRNFQGYTDDPCDILIGFGASSISEAPQGYAQNIPDPARYAEAMASDGSAIVRGVARSWREGRIGERIMQLLCTFDIPLDGDLFDPDALDGVIADGLARLENGHLKVTPAGRPYVRNIAARIDPGFQPAGQKHSRAV